MAKLDLDGFREELIGRGFSGFNPDQLDRYINWGYLRVARKTRWTWEQTAVTIPQTAGDATIDFADLPHVKSIKAVSITTPTVEQRLQAMGEDYFLKNWMPFDLTDSKFRGEPSYYYIWRNTIYLLPPPTSDRTVVVEYWQQPTPLDGNNKQTVTDEIYDEGILLEAEVVCHRRAKEVELMGYAKAELAEFYADLYAQDEFQMDEEPERVEPYSIP